MFFVSFMLQNEKSMFFQVVATALGPIPSCRSRFQDFSTLSESSVRASCVELWRLYWSIRISSPMLYICFYEYGRFNITTIITTTTTTITTSWCTRGVGKARFQQSEHDTLRDGRKENPQHKCCGNNPHLELINPPVNKILKNLKIGEMQNKMLGIAGSFFE